MVLLFVLTMVTIINGIKPFHHNIRIVGGKPGNIKDYPYLVSIEIKEKYHCGGSLIQPNVVLTAAHCTADYHTFLTFMTIRAGSSIRETGGETVGVATICDHAKFNPLNSYDYDISVLRLKKALTLNAAKQLIPLVPINIEIQDGVVATATGWGALTAGGTLSRNFQEVQVPKVSDKICSKYYPYEHITERMICFGYESGGKDACMGDSGSPLVTGGKLIGIVSWGYGCASPKQPGVYTKISNPEIHNHINTCTTKFKTKLKI